MLTQKIQTNTVNISNIQKDTNLSNIITWTKITLSNYYLHKNGNEVIISFNGTLKETIIGTAEVKVAENLPIPSTGSVIAIGACTNEDKNQPVRFRVKNDGTLNIYWAHIDLLSGYEISAHLSYFTN